MFYPKRGSEALEMCWGYDDRFTGALLLNDREGAKIIYNGDEYDDEGEKQIAASSDAVRALVEPDASQQGSTLLENQTAEPANDMFEGLGATTQTTSSLFGGGVAQKSPATGGMFSQPTAHNGGSLFGSGIFGGGVTPNSVTTGDLFSQTAASSTGGSLFGGGMFGSGSQNPATTGGMFGKPATTAAGGLLGAGTCRSPYLVFLNTDIFPLQSLPAAHSLLLLLQFLQTRRHRLS